MHVFEEEEKKSGEKRKSLIIRPTTQQGKVVTRNFTGNPIHKLPKISGKTERIQNRQLENKTNHVGFSLSMRLFCWIMQQFEQTYVSISSNIGLFRSSHVRSEPRVKLLFRKGDGCACVCSGEEECPTLFKSHFSKLLPHQGPILKFLSVLGHNFFICFP